MENRILSSESERSLQRAGLLASTGAAIAASICCIGPVLAAFLGLTSLAGLARYERYRPAFVGVTVALLAGAFYLTYRTRCEPRAPDSACATHGKDRVDRINRVVLWVVTAVVLAILTFPNWSLWLV